MSDVFPQRLCVPPQVQFCGVAFHSEGRPASLHEKLSPLALQPSRPPDVHLLVFPSAAASSPKETGFASCQTFSSSTPRSLLCSSSSDGLHAEERHKDSEVALRFLLSMAWLEPVNRELEQQGARRRERHLLSAHGDAFRVPWEDLVYPQCRGLPHGAKGRKDSPGEDGDVSISASAAPCRESRSFGTDVKAPPLSKKGDQSQRSSEEDNSEGDYVELSELPLPSFSPQKGSLTQSISLQVKVRPRTHAPQNAAATKHTAPTHTHSSGDRPSPWSCPRATSQTSASPPADAEALGAGGFGGMIAKESGGGGSGCTEQMTEEQVSKKEFDEEEMEEEELAEVVEIEEEVQVIIQQNQERMQEDEAVRGDEKKAGSEDVAPQTNKCSDGSYCEKNEELTPSVDSRFETDKTVAVPRSPGTEVGFEDGQEGQRKEGADEKAAMELNSEGNFFFLLPALPLCKRSLNFPQVTHPLVYPPTTAAGLSADPSPTAPGASGSGRPAQTRQGRFYGALLRSGAVCLPGENQTLPVSSSACLGRG